MSEPSLLDKTFNIIMKRMVERLGMPLTIRR